MFHRSIPSCQNCGEERQDLLLVRNKSCINIISSLGMERARLIEHVMSSVLIGHGISYPCLLSSSFLSCVLGESLTMYNAMDKNGKDIYIHIDLKQKPRHPSFVASREFLR